MIWAMEYNSEVMALYGEESFAQIVRNQIDEFGSRRHSKANDVVAGKFEKQVAKYSSKVEGDIPLAIFCAAAIFETKRRQLLRETEGIDGVLKVGARRPDACLRTNLSLPLYLGERGQRNSGAARGDARLPRFPLSQGNLS